MNSNASATPPRPRASQPDVRTRLLNGAIDVVRRQGFAATSISALCDAAGVSKGAFFHHFASKEALAEAAAAHWAETTSAMFRAASYHQPDDPADRVLAYIAFRREILRGPVADVTCFAGTMVQEAYGTDAIRDACRAAILGHAETLEADIDAALAAAGRPFGITAQSLARHTQAVLQGAFILAKADGDTGVAAESVDHLGRYVAFLFNKAWSTEDGTA